MHGGGLSLVKYPCDELSIDLRDTKVTLDPKLALLVLATMAGVSVEIR